MAPSTLGTFLRSFTWGHVRQLEKALTMVLGVAWTQRTGPGNRPLPLDLDSTICEVSGKPQGGRLLRIYEGAGLSSPVGHPGRHRRR